jgi:hypothetical protein
MLASHVPEECWDDIDGTAAPEIKHDRLPIACGVCSPKAVTEVLTNAIKSGGGSHVHVSPTDIVATDDCEKVYIAEASDRGAAPMAADNDEFLERKGLCKSRFDGARMFVRRCDFRRERFDAREKRLESLRDAQARRRSPQRDAQPAGVGQHGCLVFAVPRREGIIARCYSVGVAPAPVPILNSHFAATEIADNLFSAGFRVRLPLQDIAGLLPRAAHGPSIRVLDYVAIVLCHFD